MMDIIGITLLSIEEYTQYKDAIPPISGWWWLRSPGHNSGLAASVRYVGRIFHLGRGVSASGGSVRPALIFNPKSDNQIGEKIKFGGKDWTYIGGDLALADEPFCQMAFRKDGTTNDYEQSDIKKMLDEWLERRK